MRYVLNPSARASPSRGLFTDADYQILRDFYARRPELASTPLRHTPRLAAALGLAGLLVKDESRRFGLNSFKMLGVQFALERIAATRRGGLVTCATAGNHGRAVARVARTLGIPARIYVPARTSRSSIDAIRREQADVALVDGTYEDAVRQSAADAAREGWTIVSDTGWEGYEEVPRAIMLGYTRLVDECADAFDRSRPDLVVVQAGVGGLAAAVLSRMTHRFRESRPFIVVAEPRNAACVAASLAAGAPTAVEGPLDTIMAGLRCGEVSLAAWPALPLADACVTVEDAETRAAIDDLAAMEDPVHAGPSGACGLAALRGIMHATALGPVREAARLTSRSVACVIVTEGRG